MRCHFLLVVFGAFVAVSAKAFVVCAPKKDKSSRFLSKEPLQDIDTTQDSPPLTQSNWTCPMDSVCDGATTLHGRLLCASICAYEIDPNKPYFNYVNYVPGTQAKRISKGVNSVLVGKTVDGIVISFRGTRSNSPLDWLQNAAVLLSKFPKEGIQGKIHSGFNRAVLLLYEPMKETILEFLKSSDKKDIYLTGHSKGGALASIAAILMKKDPDLPDPTHVCSFASARVGNSAFRDQFNKEINQTSYENYLDIIPFLPPSNSTMEAMDNVTSAMVQDMLWTNETKYMKKDYIWDYQAVGKRRFIDKQQQIKDNVTKALDKERIKDIEAKTFLSFKKFRAAHCPSCPCNDTCDGGYLLALAPEACSENDNDESSMAQQS